MVLICFEACPGRKASKGSKDEGSASSSSKKTPLDHYLEVLSELDYDIQVLDVDARPLPESRNRVWLLGSRKGSEFTAKAWAEQVQKLQDRSSKMPVHHLASVGLTAAVPGEKKNQEAVPKWKRVSLYHENFAALVDNLFQQKRVSSDIEPKDLEDRSSNQIDWLQSATPWQKANADVCEMVVDSIMQDAEFLTTLQFCPVADLSQNAARSTVHVNGTWGTLTTSTRMLCYKQGLVAAPVTHLRILGWQPRDLKPKVLEHLGSTRFACVTIQFTKGLVFMLRPRLFADAELYEMSGNAMSLAALCKVLLPFAQHWSKSLP